jgi:hypothetical protein
MGRSFTLQRSQGASSADDPEQDDHESDHQENMNETAYGVGGDKSEQPQDEQNNSDGIEHGKYPLVD